MVFKEHSAFRFLPHFSGGKNDSSTEGEEVAGWARAFDLADAIERGDAPREIGTEFMHPVRISSQLERFQVVRSQDKLQYRLFSEDGRLLMHALQQHAERRVQFFLPSPAEKGSGPFDRSRPAFTLAFAEKHWRLVQGRCEHCAFVAPHRSCDNRGKQQVASIFHTWTAVGEEASHRMQVNIPSTSAEGGRVVWCPCIGRGDLAKAPARVPACGDGVLRLRTKEPVWDSDADGLALDFKGRCVLASTKNFQAVLANKPRRVVCQYGKIGPSSFGLDLRHPLSVIQAFAMAVAWTQVSAEPT